MSNDLDPWGEQPMRPRTSIDRNLEILPRGDLISGLEQADRRIEQLYAALETAVSWIEGTMLRDKYDILERLKPVLNRKP